ncbi:hypothetical protein GCM10010246_21550 [Streptomyces cuspidosporus]|uniref:Uncharacterized protein n=1 Tax=Streptomyces cuspidosporus TaxID=66882 RepID=A0ABN3FT77_9ACTN
MAALWSRSGASAAPAQIRAPTTSTGQGIAWPAAAVAAPTPSQAAAPDSECAGPIMVNPAPVHSPPERESVCSQLLARFASGAPEPLSTVDRARPVVPRGLCALSLSTAARPFGSLAGHTLSANDLRLGSRFPARVGKQAV